MSPTDSNGTPMKKRLLFLMSRFLDGGIDTILLEYLRNIDPEKYELTLAIGIDMAELEVHLPSVPANVKVVHLVEEPWLTKWRKRKIGHRLPAPVKIYDELVLNPVRRMLRASRLRRLVAAHDAVIDFDSTFYTDLSGISSVPVIGFYHFSISENLSRSRRHTLRQMHGMRDYTNIVLISDAMVEEGRRLFPELADKFTRIYNGYDFTRMKQRGEQPLPEGDGCKPYFVSVARLEESQKDITTLLKAYAKVVERLDAGAPQLRLIGKGRDSEMLKALADSLGLTGKALFMGFRPDAAPYIRNSLALVHSSKYEGLPLAPIEAMILGRAVIASDCPTGPAEELDGGRAGILTPVGDADALADAMTGVATDPQLRAQLEKAAIARSLTFDIHTSVNQLLDLCR